jgi:hypothetical protein
VSAKGMFRQQFLRDITNSTPFIDLPVSPT